MKINTKPNKSRLIVLSVAVVLLLSSLAYGYYTFIRSNDSSDGINYNPPTREEKDAGDEAKERAIESDENKTTGSDPLPEPVEQEDGSKSVVGVNIVAATRNGDTYRIQTFIQAVTNTGQCTLVVTDGTGKVYSATADIQALPSSSTCKGFSIPVAELSAGKWNIDLQFENETLRGSIQKEMEVS